ncbi:MAG: DegQ family serine endoprotease [Methylobacteriaceae bacterium]|nr:DegQ family serine endoprotease [Methylobacteriaceae bacterium]
MLRFAALFLVCVAAPALAQTPAPRQAPATRAEVQLSFAPVVKKAQPAVVNVYAQRIERVRPNPLFDDPIFRRFFGMDRGPQSRTSQSLGSGVIVDPAGYVVTNHHVIEGMTEVKVALADRREIEAEIVLRDPRTDLAVLKLKTGGNYPALDYGDSDALEVGDLVLAIGNPFGVGQTVTQGIISALARTQVGVSDYGFFIQTDAAINPGNSGGALVDMQARLIGVNSAILSKSGGSVGIGFSIPSNMVRIVVEAARSGGKQVRRPWVGATLQPLQKDLAESIGLDRPAGALVSIVRDGSPAAQAGLKRGDVIVSVDGQAIDDPEGFGWRVGAKALGATATFGLLRAGKPVSIVVKMQPAPETTPRAAVKLKNRSPFSGATAWNLSPAAAEELGVDAQQGTVVVAEVESGTPAEEVGLQKGDVIVSLNDQKIDSTKDLETATAERKRYWKITIERGGQVFTSVVGG